ncbi:MAG TPA: phosphotransferase [Pyrinomonadaceae bacterium]|nr:phosphotransferase [Pyrinomonadaceae bacterium]
MSDLSISITKFLASRGMAPDFEALTADASTREYFRINWNGEPAIACVYPEPFDADTHPYLDVTNLFLACDLPVAQILDVDGDLGVFVLEDLGDRILRDVMGSMIDNDDPRLLREAISLIARVQTATNAAYERNSIASKLKFDTEKLLWELNFFKEHYFQTYKRSELSKATDEALSQEFLELSRDLEAYATVLCHRDFHAANLMIDRNGKMRIIDHQDARIGSPAYDLVSLLLDRITTLPSPEWLADKRRYFLDVRRTLGMPKLDEVEFAYEFRLQTLQRCLKAAGTFSYQSVMRNKTHFVPFIIPMFRITARAISNLGRFPVLNEVLLAEIAASESAEPHTLK